jgi:cobalt-zinc-cadmium efflux system protein
MARQTLRVAFLLTIVILAAELAGGFFANSLALFSDAGHVITDLFALGLAWFAVAQTEKKPNERKTFGYHRVGILAALINAVTLIVIALIIIFEAIQRFQHPEPVQPFIMFISAVIGIAVNLFIGFGLQKGHDNLNMRAAALHVFGDVAASVGVIIAAAIILRTGWTLADPILSVGIALLISIGAWRIVRETSDILLESVPKNVSMTRLVEDMKQVAGVKDVHDLHVWSITSGMNALSCHVTIDNLPPSDSSPILQSLTTILYEKYHIGHTTIQFDAGSYCEIDGLYCRMDSHKEHSCDHTHERAASPADEGVVHLLAKREGVQ